MKLLWKSWKKVFVGTTHFCVSVCVLALFVFVCICASLLHHKVTAVIIRSANLLLHTIQSVHKPVKERKVWEKWVKRWRTVVDIMTLVHSLEFWELKRTPQPSLSKLFFIMKRRVGPAVTQQSIFLLFACVSGSISTSLKYNGINPWAFGGS